MGGNGTITQKDMILRHLQEQGSITTWTAIKEYGITRLAARISDLRKEGHMIVGETVSAVNRYNEPVYFTKYRLEEEQ